MSKTGSLLCSSVAQKFLMGLTGLGLVVFLILHLAGNLLLYAPSPEWFNAYGARLDSLGTFKLVAEFGLLALFGAHIVQAIRLKRNHVGARPQRYAMLRSKGGPSKSNVSSTTMAISGLAILIFLILHVRALRFGPGVAEGYVTTVHGEQARDLYRVVDEMFMNPLIVGFYILVMLLVGSHLRHGFWSAFQSLGVNRPGLSKALYCGGYILAGLLAVGFLGIPVYMFLQK